MKLLSTSAIILSMAATAPAVAGGQTDIDQILTNLQVSLNSITNSHNNNNISQAATNAGNLISTEDVTLDDVMQLALLTVQVAGNNVSTVWGGYNNLEQVATNVLNSLSMTEPNTGSASVNDVRQATLFSFQFAGNRVDYNQNVRDASQAATNAANIAAVEDIHEGIGQYWLASPQIALNRVTGGGASSFVSGLTQDAANVANSVSADDIDSSPVGIEALQIAAGFQLAANTVAFGDGCGNGSGVCGVADPATIALEDVTQTALNAVNIIEVDELRGIADQSADVMQAAYNGAYYTSGGGGWQNGEVSNLTQEATNAANIITANWVSSISGLQEITQTSTSIQLAGNNLVGNGGINTVAQAATNVANSVSIGVTPPSP